MGLKQLKNKLEPEDIEWEFLSSMAMSRFHHAVLRDNRFGIQKEMITSKKNGESFSKPKIYYFIDYCEREFTNIEELCKVWNELKDFDDPDSEIVWVKVIKKKDDRIGNKNDRAEM